MAIDDDEEDFEEEEEFDLRVSTNQCLRRTEKRKKGKQVTQGRIKDKEQSSQFQP
jgi:hypothetical protein